MDESEWLASDDPRAMLEWRIGLGRQSQFGVPTYTAPSDRKLRLFVCACVRQVWHLLKHRDSRAAVEAAERHADGLMGKRELMGFATAAAIVARTDADYAACGAAVDHPVSAARSSGHVLDATQRGGPLAALLREIVGNPFRPVEVPQTRTYCARCGSDDCEHDEDDACRCAVCGADAWVTDRGWLTPTVLALAQAAYEERARECEGCGGTGAAEPGTGRTLLGTMTCRACHGTGRIKDGSLDPVRLAILADALEEAGCTDEAILRHLRGRQSCFTCGGKGLVTSAIGTPQICWDCKFTYSIGAAASAQHLGCGFIELPGPHVRGCWAIDLVLGKD